MISLSLFKFVLVAVAVLIQTVACADTCVAAGDPGNGDGIQMSPTCDAPAFKGLSNEKHHCTFQGRNAYKAFSYYFPNQAAQTLMIGFDSGNHPTTFQVLLSNGEKKWYSIGANTHCDLLLAHFNVGEMRYW